MPRFRLLKFLRSKRKESDLLTKAVIYFKYLCIAYGLFLFAMALALPPTEMWAAASS